MDEKTLNFQEQVELAIQREKARVKRKLMYAVLLLAAVYVVAIIIYHATESWSWEDAVYFTTATITTVGYGDIVPHTYYGRLITIPLMFIGIAVGLYTIYAIQDYGKANLGGVAKGVGTRLDNVESGRKRMVGHVDRHVERIRRMGRKK
ncbi:MAG: potassium channel family protein [Candidatus Micrarchaeota archaeon]|nr:potassium channel family protein [Candidatus Micrarchaeota archaeon]